MALLKKDKKKSEVVEPKIGDYAILDKPVITEKSGSIGGGVKGGITFRVDRRADKTQIKAAVERIFKVKVDKIRTANYIGKQKRTMKSVGRRAAYKKAYVTLKEGFTINLVEGV
jgi:large subunit ribosomal protein L23